MDDQFLHFCQKKSVYQNNACLICVYFNDTLYVLFHYFAIATVYSSLEKHSFLYQS